MRDDRDDHAQPFVVWLSGFSRETDVVKWLGNLMKLPLAEIDESLTAQSARLKRRIFKEARHCSQERGGGGIQSELPMTNTIK